MPNTGKPSRDCHLCRQRRVKCDLGRPSCQRCIKYGTECPGYRNEQDVVFRNETSRTLRRTKPAAAKSQSSKQGSVNGLSHSFAGVIDFNDTPSHYSSSSSSSSSSASSSPLSSAGGLDVISKDLTPYATPSFSPTRELRESWTLHSVPLLLSCYAPVAFLTPIFEKLTSPNEPLIMATHLWARAYLASCFHAPQDRRETALHLGNTLRSVAVAVQDGQKGTSDGTILAVWILGMYELQIGGIGPKANLKSAWHIHLEGLLSLLRARGRSQFYTPFGRYIFWCVFMTIQTGCIMNNQVCPPETEEWIGLLEDTMDPDEGWSLMACKYVYRASFLVAAIFPIVHQGLFDEARRTYADIASQTNDLELGILGWMAQASPEELTPGSHTNYFWNSWRGTRLKLHNFLFMLANLVEHTPTNLVLQPSKTHDAFALRATKDQCLVIIATAAQEVVDAIPISLGGKSHEFATEVHASWFEGMCQISPLSAVYTTRTVPKPLRNTARLALIAIGKERGILQALKARPGAVQYASAATIGISLDDAVEEATEVE